MTATEIVTECELDQPPQKVWRALTVPELMTAWLLPRSEEAANDALTLDGSAAGLGARIDCELLQAEPHRLLRYRWREQAATGDARGHDTIVTFHLEARGIGGTFLRIVHRDAIEACARIAMSAANTNRPLALRRAA